MSLQPFDATRRCPKCDSRKLDDRHSGEPYNRIRRTCFRCGFRWEEAAADYDELSEVIAAAEFHIRASDYFFGGAKSWEYAYLEHLKQKQRERDHVSAAR